MGIKKTNDKNKGGKIENATRILSDALKELFDSPPYEKSYAVVIGINKYRNMDQKEWLSFAVNDAKEMEKYLHNDASFDYIISLYDSAATEEAIKDSIIGLKNKLTKKNDNEKTDDRIVIYFSGHGGTLGGTTGYLIPYEGTINKPHTHGISISWLTEEVKQVIPAKHILFIFDNCYSGLGFKDKGSSKRWARTLAENPSIRLLTAGTSQQTVIEVTKLKQSLYTFHLLKGLRGQADHDSNQVITISELHSYVHNMVSKEAIDEYKKRQTPQIYPITGEWEIIFYKTFLNGKEKQE